MIAALPMYDLPGLEAANAALWQAVAGGLRRAGILGVPDGLTRPRDLLELWNDPGLLLAQACGLPFVTLLEGRVRFVAAPVYNLPGAAGGSYRSWLVAGEGAGFARLLDLRGRIAAINAPHSQSGASALLWATIPHAAAAPFFARVIVTGSHLASIEAVRDGSADIAAIDTVTWALAGRATPAALAGLRVIGAGPEAPTLPFVTSLATPAATLETLRSALAAAIADPANAATCRALGLAGMAPFGVEAYARIETLYRAGLARGCARLATLMQRDMAFARKGAMQE